MKMDMKIRRRKKFRYKNELIAGLVVIAIALLIICCVYFDKKQPVPVVTLTISHEEMYENEEIPAFQVKVTWNTEENVILERAEKYTLEDLKIDIEQGSGYEILHEVDSTEAGCYPVSLKLSKDYGEKIQLVIQEGSLLVNEYIDPSRPMVALTFDDGPGPYTMQLLEGLEASGAKATFFMLGSRVHVYPEAVKRMVEIGCEVANHSTNHMQLTKIDDDMVRSEVNGTNEAIHNVCGETPKYLRPPYGAYDERIQGLVEMPMILWSIDTMDWKSKDVETIKEIIRTTMKDGDIVLMHDIYETTVDAILELIPELQEQGYQFVTLTELAESRGVEYKVGEAYGNLRIE